MAVCMVDKDTRVRTTNQESYAVSSSDYTRPTHLQSMSMEKPRLRTISLMVTCLRLLLLTCSAEDEGFPVAAATREPGCGAVAVAVVEVTREPGCGSMLIVAVVAGTDCWSKGLGTPDDEAVKGGMEATLCGTDNDDDEDSGLLRFLPVIVEAAGSDRIAKVLVLAAAIGSEPSRGGMAAAAVAVGLGLSVSVFFAPSPPVRC